MGLRRDEKTGKVLVIGLEGGTFDILKPLVGAG